LAQQLARHKISIFGKKLCLPRSLLLRRVVGALFVAGGPLGFFPVLGFWLLPLGLVILSPDSSHMRRFRRRAEIMVLRRWQASRFNRKTSTSAKKTKVAIRVT